MEELTPITTEMLTALIRQKEVGKLRELFDEYNIVDMAALVEQLELPDALFIFKTLKKDITADIFSYLDYDKQEQLIALFTGPEITAMLDHLYSDDIVYFIEEMPANVVNRVLQAATPKQRAEINMLLSYKEYTAGSIMTIDYVELKMDDTNAKAIERVKKQEHLAETVNVCYVVDHTKRLVGIVTLRDLILAKSDTLISDMMETDVIYARTYDDQEQVALLIQKYDINVVPVVNDEQCLVGIITVDDILDVIQEEATEDIHKMAAIQPLEESYLKTGVLRLAKSRIVWLLILMISATFTGLILQSFESALAAHVALSFFIPMLTDTSGNAGGQSAALVMRGIALGEVEIKHFFVVLWKELRVALICGFILAVATFIRIHFFTSTETLLALVVSITVLIAVVMAKLVGGILPLIAVVVKQDPAVMASPLITTIVDALALTIYFTLARFILKI